MVHSEAMAFVKLAAAPVTPGSPVAAAPGSLDLSVVHFMSQEIPVVNQTALEDLLYMKRSMLIHFETS